MSHILVYMSFPKTATAQCYCPSRNLHNAEYCSLSTMVFGRVLPHETMALQHCFRSTSAHPQVRRQTMQQYSSSTFVLVLLIFDWHFSYAMHQPEAWPTHPVGKAFTSGDATSTQTSVQEAYTATKARAKVAGVENITQ